MVDDVSPAMLAQWRAVAWLDGWGEEWQRTATMCATIWNAAIRLSAFWRTQENPVRENEWKAPADFLPSHLRDKTTKPQMHGSRETLEAGMKRMAGVKD